MWARLYVREKLFLAKAVYRCDAAATHAIYFGNIFFRFSITFCRNLRRQPLRRQRPSDTHSSFRLTFSTSITCSRTVLSLSVVFCVCPAIKIKRTCTVCCSLTACAILYLHVVWSEQYSSGFVAEIQNLHRMPSVSDFSRSIHTHTHTHNTYECYASPLIRIGVRTTMWRCRVSSPHRHSRWNPSAPRGWWRISRLNGTQPQRAHRHTVAPNGSARRVRARKRPYGDIAENYHVFGSRVRRSFHLRFKTDDQFCMVVRFRFCASSTPRHAVRPRNFSVQMDLIVVIFLISMVRQRSAQTHIDVPNTYNIKYRH